MADIRYNTVHVAFWILFRTNTVLPCKRERKALLYNLTPQRYIWVGFFSQMRSFDRKGGREEGKTREICTSQLDQDEPITSNELGQQIGRQMLASATSAAGFPLLVGKTKNPHFWAKHRDMMSQDPAELVSLSRPLALVLL